MHIHIDVTQMGAATDIGNRYRGLFLPDRMEHGIYDLLDAIVQLRERGSLRLRDSKRVVFPSLLLFPFSELHSRVHSTGTWNLRG